MRTRGSLGSALVALVVILSGLGYLLYRWLQPRAWLVVVFVALVVGFTYMVLVMFADYSGARDRKKHG